LNESGTSGVADAVVQRAIDTDVEMSAALRAFTPRIRRRYSTCGYRCGCASPENAKETPAFEDELRTTQRWQHIRQFQHRAIRGASVPPKTQNMLTDSHVFWSMARNPEL